ncbi:hypothetical protein CYMTET_49863 [Cymbomonas tetramitiformis]|uniref:Uncharacterized protein n=1 Tax=Cymbomonas tetramitiformis TaxID=36881 RepID=A0AAE0BR14_9CHLO|nr:hypothetical protein CYMTET_49863 [Cymbomonas tetramitiformis]
MITELNNTDYYGALPDSLGPEDVCAIAAPRFLRQLQLLPVISLHPAATPENTARIGSLHRMVKIDKNKGRFIIAQCATYREPGGAIAALVLSHLWESLRTHLLRHGHMFDLPLWPFLKDGEDFALFLLGVKDDVFSLFTADATRFFTNLPAQDHINEGWRETVTSGKFTSEPTCPKPGSRRVSRTVGSMMRTEWKRESVKAGWKSKTSAKNQS